MFTRLKTNIALLICLVFISRLLFVNTSLLSASNTPQNNSSLAIYFSTMQKKKRNTEAVIGSNDINYTAIEVCEEDSDEDDLTKIHPPIMLSAFYSFFQRIPFISKSNNACDLIKCDLYPKKYMTRSILRI
jgi:hypothetical protein